MFNQRAPGVDEVSKPPQVVTEEKLGLLWPQPHHIIQQEGPAFRVKKGLNVFVSAGHGTGRLTLDVVIIYSMYSKLRL